MPIEIKELVIRATIDPKGEDRKPSTQSTGGTRDEIIAECVEQVLAILAKQQER